MRNTNALMEFLEPVKISTATGLTASSPISIPTVPDEGLVCLIWKVDFLPEAVVPIEVDGKVDFALSKTVDVYRQDSPAVLCGGSYRVLGRAVLSGAEHPEYMNLQHYFDPPIAVARPTLYLVVVVDAQLTSAGCYCKIGYTIEKVPQNVLLRALIE